MESGDDAVRRPKFALTAAASELKKNAPPPGKLEYNSRPMMKQRNLFG